MYPFRRKCYLWQFWNFRKKEKNYLKLRRRIWGLADPTFVVEAQNKNTPPAAKKKGWGWKIRQLQRPGNKVTIHHSSVICFESNAWKNIRACYLVYSSQTACNHRAAVTRLAALIRNVNINKIFFPSFRKSLVILCNQFGIKKICCVGWKIIIIRMGSSGPHLRCLR